MLEIIETPVWIFYSTKDKHDLISDKTGKWMYFFSNKDFVKKICTDAINEGIVSSCKHSNDDTGVACFYINSDDLISHKKVISFLLSNNLIQRTKSGKLYNISFKLDSQTRSGEYGNDFKGEIKLEQFINLETGEWK